MVKCIKYWWVGYWTSDEAKPGQTWIHHIQAQTVTVGTNKQCYLAWKELHKYSGFLKISSMRLPYCSNEGDVHWETCMFLEVGLQWAGCGWWDDLTFSGSMCCILCCSHGVQNTHACDCRYSALACGDKQQQEGALRVQMSLCSCYQLFWVLS